jgi:hypothetical protein
MASPVKFPDALRPLVSNRCEDFFPERLVNVARRVFSAIANWRKPITYLVIDVEIAESDRPIDRPNLVGFRCALEGKCFRMYDQTSGAEGIITMSDPAPLPVDELRRKYLLGCFSISIEPLSKNMEKLKRGEQLTSADIVKVIVDPDE